LKNEILLTNILSSYHIFSLYILRVVVFTMVQHLFVLLFFSIVLKQIIFQMVGYYFLKDILMNSISHLILVDFSSIMDKILKRYG